MLTKDGGKNGILKLSDKIYVSPPYSLHIKLSITEATYIFKKIPVIDFYKPYKVSFWIYLGDDCDDMIVYQDRYFRLIIKDNAPKIHEKRAEGEAGELGYKHVINLEKETWYNVVAVVDPNKETVTVTVGGITVTGKFTEPPLKTYMTDNKGRIRIWDVILGDLSHNTGEGAIYIDDLAIVQTITAFDFTISVRHGDEYVREIEIEEGETATLTIEVELFRVEPRPVTLSVIGLPSDVSYSINPPMVTPPGTSVLTIKAGSTTGTFSVDAKGSGDGKEEIIKLPFCPQLSIILIIPAALIAFYRKNK